MSFKITEKNINEDNILNFIEERKEQSYLDIYLELDNCVKNKTRQAKYDSLKDNYVPIFLFHIMNKKITLKEFDKILKNSNYESGLNRFFGESDIEYNDSLSDSCSYWEKMDWFFYTKDNNDKVFFDKEKLPYVKSILKNIHKNNIYDFHCSKIHFFLSHVFLKEPLNFTDFFEIMNNKVLLLEHEGEYNSLPHAIIRNIADVSYEKDVHNQYQILKSTKLTKKIMDNKLIDFDSGGENLTINLSLLNMIKNNENIEDTLTILNETFYEKIKNNPGIKEKNTFTLAGSLYVGLEKTNFNLDLKKIDTSKSWKENYIYLSLLSILLQEKKFNHIKNATQNLQDYLSDFDFDTMIKKETISTEERHTRLTAFHMNPFENLDKVIFYENLNKKISGTNKQTQKNKI